MAKADNLTACCEYYLNHEEEREAITEAAYNFVRDSFTQEETAAHSCSK
jgi:spore maturation protein CgeB